MIVIAALKVEPLRISQDAAHAGAFVTKHMAFELLQGGKPLENLPLRDRVGAMVLSGVILRLLAGDDSAMGQVAREAAIEIFGQIGASTSLVPPTRSSMELIEQLQNQTHGG